MFNINTEIAKRTGLDESVVRRVVKEMRKIAIDEIVNTGTVNISGICKITIGGKCKIKEGGEIGQTVRLKAKALKALIFDVQEAVEEKARTSNMKEEEIIFNLIQESEMKLNYIE